MTQTNSWGFTKDQMDRLVANEQWLRIAYHRTLSPEKQVLCFDAEGNWIGDDSPHDIKAYWANLSDTERAFERLERTDAAVFIEFVEKIERSIPEPHIAP